MRKDSKFRLELIVPLPHLPKIEVGQLRLVFNWVSHLSPYLKSIPMVSNYQFSGLCMSVSGMLSGS